MVLGTAILRNTARWRASWCSTFYGAIRCKLDQARGLMIHKKEMGWHFGGCGNTTDSTRNLARLSTRSDQLGVVFSPPFNRWVIARRAPGSVFFEQPKPLQFDEVPRRRGR